MATKKRKTPRPAIVSEPQPQVKENKGKRIIMKNSIVYACDYPEKMNTVYIFMYSEINDKAGKRPYSVMTIYDGRKNIKSLTVYNNGIGPALSMKNLREATAEEREIFFDAAASSNLQFIQKTGRWQTLGEKKPVVEPIPNQDEVKSLYNKGDVIGILCYSEDSDNVSKVIGEVERVINDNTIVLNSWAYKNSPEIVFGQSQIVVAGRFDISISTYYEFMISRFDSINSLKTDNEDDELLLADRKKYIASKLLKSVVEDTTQKHTKVLISADEYEDGEHKKYFLAKDFTFFTHPDETSLILGEITNLINYVAPTGNIEPFFGKENIDDYNKFLDDYEEYKEGQEKESQKQTISVETFAEQYEQEIQEESNPEDSVVKETVVESPASDASNDAFINMNWIDVYKAFEPRLYENTTEAAYTIDDESAEFFIIINEIDFDHVLFRLSDDPMAELYSRKINKKGQTAILGPIRDASATFSIIKKKLAENWIFDENDVCSEKVKSPENNLSAAAILTIISDIVEIQRAYFGAFNGYRLIDYPTSILNH